MGRIARLADLRVCGAIRCAVRPEYTSVLLWLAALDNCSVAAGRAFDAQVVTGAGSVGAKIGLAVGRHQTGLRNVACIADASATIYIGFVPILFAVKTIARFFAKTVDTNLRKALGVVRIVGTASFFGADRRHGPIASTITERASGLAASGADTPGAAFTGKGAVLEKRPIQTAVGRLFASLSNWTVASRFTIGLACVFTRAAKGIAVFDFAYQALCSAVGVNPGQASIRIRGASLKDVCAALGVVLGRADLVAVDLIDALSIGAHQAVTLGRIGAGVSLGADQKTASARQAGAKQQGQYG